jgi:hypothetical protein
MRYFFDFIVRNLCRFDQLLPLHHLRRVWEAKEAREIVGRIFLLPST